MFVFCAIAKTFVTYLCFSGQTKEVLLIYLKNDVLADSICSSKMSKVAKL